jgi:hypothetical protein
MGVTETEKQTLDSTLTAIIEEYKRFRDPAWKILQRVRESLYDSHDTVSGMRGGDGRG